MASGLFGTGARIGDLTKIGLQPAGIPGSTFVRAPMREAGGNLRALADALGGLNSALQNFAAVQSRNEEDPNSRANREWVARRQQMSIEQLREEARNGTADGIRVREDALNAMLGERANDDFRRAWLEFYNTEFDRTSGDAAAEYERMRQEYAAGLPSEISRGNFYRLTGDHFRSWMEKDTEEKVSYVKQELNTTIVDSFRNSIDDAVSIHGKTPQEAAEIVFAKSASNRDFLGLSGQEQNDTIFRIAEEYALKGEEEIARALLDGNRKGADGKPLPPLSKIAGYTDKAIRLIEQAGDIRDQRVRERGFESFAEDQDLILRGAFTKDHAEARRGSGLYSDAQLAEMLDQSNRRKLAIEEGRATAEQKRALRRRSELAEQKVYSEAYSLMDTLGGINRIEDVEIPSATGEGTKRLSKQSIVDAVVSRKEDDFEEHQETLIANGMDPEQARQVTNRLRVEWYAGNKIENDQWSNTLNGIAGRATTDKLLEKGEVSTYLRQSVDLYRQLKAVNPAYLSTILTDPKSKEFLEAYDNGVTYRRMPSDEALLNAATVTAQPESLKARSLMDYQRAKRLADRTLSSLDLDPRATNHAYVMDRINSLSRNGATEKEIKATIEKEILETAVPVNGVLVFASSELPDDFPELMQMEIEQRFKEQAENFGLEDTSDLYIVSDPAESKWTIWSKSLQMPVGTAPITPATLEARREEIRKEHEARVREIAKAKDAERAEQKKTYEADIAAKRARIEYWREQAGKRTGLRASRAAAAANRLERDLEEQLRRDREAIELTPDQRATRMRRRMGKAGHRDR